MLKFSKLFEENVAVNNGFRLKFKFKRKKKMSRSLNCIETSQKFEELIPSIE